MKDKILLIKGDTMDLRATINGIQYDILQGATFAEEFNETLDSGSIIINNVQR